MKSPLIPGFPIWLFHINLRIYLFTFKSRVIFIDYSMQHLVPKQKLTYHYIDFLQMKESLKKAKSLKTRKNHFVVPYM